MITFDFQLSVEKKECVCIYIENLRQVIFAETTKMLSTGFIFILLAGIVGVCIAEKKVYFNDPSASADAAEWAQFKIKYDKFYTAEEEEAHRFAVWKRNKKFVAEHDSRNFSVALNHLADLTTHEVVRRLPLAASNNKFDSTSSFEYVSLSSSPQDAYVDFDWRVLGAIGPVENQGAQGSAAAVVVLNVLESQYNITLKKPFSTLSMDEIQRCCLDNSTSSWSTTPEYILKCLQDAKGIEFATCPAKQQHKKEQRQRLFGISDTSDCKVSQQCLAEQIKTWAKVPDLNETLMAEALKNDGPLIAQLDASQLSFQLYSGAIYDDINCSKTTYDHVVIIVGYGTASDGTQYWIVKNSWGTGWGMGGYMWIKRGGNTCAIATAPTNVFVH